MKFIELLKKAFTENIPIKLLALGLAFVAVVIINALNYTL